MAVVKKLVEGQHTWEFVVSEEEKYASRDTITIDINQTIVPGTVLAHKGAAVGVITTPGVGTWAAWVSGDANYGAPAVSPAKASPPGRRPQRRSASCAEMRRCAGATCNGPARRPHHSRPPRSRSSKAG
jgi:hypothetical protein